MNDREELIEAYDGTAPYAMTLQQFVRFDKYVRCFTFGKSDIVPVAYDPVDRCYLVEHDYLSRSSAPAWSATRRRSTRRSATR